MLRLSFILLGMLLLASCQRFREDDPVSTYSAFVSAVQKGEDAKAFGLLSAQTRAGLSRRAEAVASVSGGSLKDDPAALFLSGGRSPPVSHVEVASRTADAAVLTVSAGGVTREVRMVREQAGWRIDLPAAGP